VPSLLKLNCWVLGEDSARIFPVEVDHDSNVGGLKEAIKETMKPAFDHITANSLDVWNVSIHTDQDTNLQAQVNGLKVLEKKPLFPLVPLSGIFQDVVEQCLHVIVRTSTSECSRDFSLSSSNNTFLCR
jgi:Crinkler effector protein N-terminal domain